MKTVEIEKRMYVVDDEEFKTFVIQKYCNLNILEKIGFYERIVALLCDISQLMKVNNCLVANPTHGGYVPINCANVFDTVYISNVLQRANIDSNLKETNVIPYDDNQKPTNLIVFAEKYVDLDTSLVPDFLLTEMNSSLVYYKSYKLSGTNLSLHISNREKDDEFQKHFYYCIHGDQLTYDNLINLCIMVKNAGPQFEDMLNKNLHLVDEWSILDTGSTDETLEIINRVLVGKKRGELFQEPFINFRDSRNRLLELASKRCKFTLTLDDTYRIEGKLREFLNDVRGDQFSDSFSLYIKSDDMEYSSNRIIKTNRNLRYKYRIHEVIENDDNNNVIIPNDDAFIDDGRFEYMEERTMNRKQLDLKLLFEELEEDPDNPRTHYYLAQTYNLLGEHEKAFQYFMERINHTNTGFLQEKIDATFEAARQANFTLGKPWYICEELYLKAYELDKTRPDSLYFLGIHYYLEGSKQVAYNYFKKGFELGYPVHCQYGLKPTLTYHFLPKFLTELCYDMRDFELGERTAKFFLANNPSTADGYQIQLSWHNIFVNLNNMKLDVTFDVRTDKPLLCFVADGGFEPWTGADILTKGVGGSETYIIEMARYIQKQGFYKVSVFCNCLSMSVFEDVDYIPLNYFQPFARKVKIDTCIISRFTEYIPVAIHGQVENLYLVLHDLTPSGVVIPMSSKLKNIFCLSEWHVGYFLERFPMFKDVTVPFYYGIRGSSPTGGLTPAMTLTPDGRGNKYGVSTMKSQGSVIQLPDHIGSAADGSTHKASAGGEAHIGQKVNDLFLSTGQKVNDVFLSTREEVNGGLAPVFIYSSFPNRGLLQLLQMWPKIFNRYPSASLHIYADVDGKWVNSVEKNMMIQIRQLLKEIKAQNIVYHGWVSKPTLAKAWASADYWLYPCTFMETFCLTALEAAISKTLCITNGLAALQNTVGDRGICVEGDATTREWQESALTALFSIMENREMRETLVDKNYKWVFNLTWENQALKLSNEYFLKNTKTKTNKNREIVDGGLKNWTHDLPQGQNAKETFEKVIRFFVNNNSSENPKVLEIGTYAGTSLIEILKQIPNSAGTAIDKWESYDEINKTQLINQDILKTDKTRKSLDTLKNIKVNGIEQSFYHNVAAAGMQNRVRGIKGNSSSVLLDMVKQNVTYDFIYVDGSHKCLDVALDLFLAWQLLRDGGILAIDDYLYSLEKDLNVNVLEYPFHAVNHFLEAHKNEIVILEKGCRVFILRSAFIG